MALPGLQSSEPQFWSGQKTLALDGVTPVELLRVEVQGPAQSWIVQGESVLGTNFLPGAIPTRTTTFVVEVGDGRQSSQYFLGGRPIARGRECYQGRTIKVSAFSNAPGVVVTSRAYADINPVGGNYVDRAMTGLPTRFQSADHSGGAAVEVLPDNVRQQWRRGLVLQNDIIDDIVGDPGDLFVAFYDPALHGAITTSAYSFRLAWRATYEMPYPNYFGPVWVLFPARANPGGRLLVTELVT
jgi:hypothetical protein